MKTEKMREDSNWDNVDKYVDNCFFDTWNCGNNEGKKGMWIKKTRVFRQNDENEYIRKDVLKQENEVSIIIK